MEYILINDSKLKIICEKNDLAPHGINADDLDYGDSVSRKFIEGLLEEAKIKLGFETAKYKVLIQLFPDKYGGCEIFVSKLGLLSKSFESERDSEQKESVEKKRKCEPSQKIFFFERLDFLLEACKRMSFLPPCKKSSLFYLDKSGYYLYFEIEEESLEEYGINTLNEYSFLLEYGEPQSVKEKMPYLKEYANNICNEGAIEALCKI